MSEPVTVILSDSRCDEDERYVSIQVSSAEELATYLHGVYKITKAVATGYAHVVLAGVYLHISVEDKQNVSMLLRGHSTTLLPLRSKVLHPSGKSYSQRLEDEQAERDIRAYAAFRRTTKRRGA